MKLTNAIILPAVFFIITCAYGQDVHYDYARGTNFSTCRTHQWVDVQRAPTKIDPPKGLLDPRPPCQSSTFQAVEHRATSWVRCQMIS